MAGRFGALEFVDSIIITFIITAEFIQNSLMHICLMLLVQRAPLVSFIPEVVLYKFLIAIKKYIYKYVHGYMYAYIYVYIYICIYVYMPAKSIPHTCVYISSMNVID